MNVAVAFQGLANRRKAALRQLAGEPLRELIERLHHDLGVTRVRQAARRPAHGRVLRPALLGGDRRPGQAQ
jgi:hypothetical protein